MTVSLNEMSTVNAFVNDYVIEFKVDYSNKK